MRRERQDTPTFTMEEKGGVRLDQVEACRQKSVDINLGRLPKEALSSYQKIVSERETGTDVSSEEYRQTNSTLITDASPVLDFALTAGYLENIFKKLLIRCAIDKPDNSFSLINTNPSSDGNSFDENEPFILLFQNCEKAWDIVNNWDIEDKVQIFLDAVRADDKPILLPNLRRDMGARTALLQDYKDHVGGAQLTLPTSIFGVTIENNYADGKTEFPDLKVAVSRLS